MKINKKYKIYKAYNQLSGDEIIIDFKPNKKDLLIIAEKESWGGSTEEREENIESGEYTYTGIDVYTK